MKLENFDTCLIVPKNLQKPTIFKVIQHLSIILYLKICNFIVRINKHLKIEE